MTVAVFSVPVFFVIFRETVEVGIIISVLLAFLKQTLDGPDRDVVVYKKLRKQVWMGTAVGLLVCGIIGGAIIGVFYGIGTNKWSAVEYYWEGAFALFASCIITVVGGALLRVSKMQEKWRVKLAKALEETPIGMVKSRSVKRWFEKYSMFALPFITILREGLEAIVFVTGVTFAAPGSSIPLAIFVGLVAGIAVNYLLYKGGSTSKLQLFLVISTCILYLVAAGLFSKAVWFFEQQEWNIAVGGDAAETGAGPGSYDIDRSVWHINFGNPGLNGGGGWGIFKAILGWTNSATYGSVISYNVYWIFVIAMFVLMRFKETKGYYPGLKSYTERKASKKQAREDAKARNGSESATSSQLFEGKDQSDKVAGQVREVPSRTISD